MEYFYMNNSKSFSLFSASQSTVLLKDLLVYKFCFFELKFFRQEVDIKVGIYSYNGILFVAKESCTADIERQALDMQKAMPHN